MRCTTHYACPCIMQRLKNIEEQEHKLEELTVIIDELLKIIEEGECLSLTGGKW